LRDHVSPVYPSLFNLVFPEAQFVSFLLAPLYPLRTDLLFLFGIFREDRCSSRIRHPSPYFSFQSRAFSGRTPLKIVLRLDWAGRFGPLRTVPSSVIDPFFHALMSVFFLFIQPAMSAGRGSILRTRETDFSQPLPFFP